MPSCDDIQILIRDINLFEMFSRMTLILVFHFFQTWLLMKCISLTLSSPIKFCASMWSKSESDEIQRIAKETVPGIKTMAIPQGLQVEKGPDAVVEFLKEKWPGLVEA